MNLSKSRYCSAIQCPKILWMREHMPEEYDDGVMDENVLSTGNRVGDLAMGYYGEFTEIPYRDDKSEMIAATQAAIDSGAGVIAEASFAYDGNFCSVDILRNFGDHVEIVEVKSSTGLHEIYLHDMAYQCYVLQHCGLNVTRVSLMHINNRYVRHGELDIQSLFTVENHTDKVFDLLGDIPENIAKFKAIAVQDSEPDRDIGMQCSNPYTCGFQGYCWKHIPEKSVFGVARMRGTKKFNFYYEGKITYSDLLENKDMLNDREFQQVDFELNKRKPAVDKQAIQSFLNTLSYPLYFLDFETMQQAIPEYDGIRPYAQIPFQYSLHIVQSEGDKPQHREFLAEERTDPRRALAEKLIADIPQNVCVLAYNMSFEKSVLRALAEQFSELSVHLLSIHDNMKDLMIPFQKRFYYSREMGGSYSIKYVLPALCPGDPELDYGALPLIHNGAQAQHAFDDAEHMTPDQIAQTRHALLAYCRLDTLAMVKILEKLWECVGTR